MENNENNVQEQVKKVKKDVPKGNAAKGFVVAALLIVFLGIGFGFGFLCSKGWNPFAIKTSSKKIDESKPWVYDVDFQGKQVGDENTADYVKVPYININSEDAKKTNDKIKELYENFNENFEGEITNAKDSRISLKYDKYESTKYVSIIIKESYGYKNGSSSTMKEYAYTFDLETLKLVSFDEILNAKQYSKEEVNQKISALISKTKESIKNGPYSETAKVSFNNDFYIDENGKVKVLISINDTTFGFRLRHVFMGYGIDEDTVEENNTVSSEETQQESDFSVFSQYKGQKYRNEDFNTTPEVFKEYCILTFDDDGKPTIKMGYKSDNNTECYFQTKEISNLKSEGAAGTTYVTFDFNAWTAGGDTTGSATISYNKVSENDYTMTVSAKVNYNIGAKEYNNITVKQVGQTAMDSLLLPDLKNRIYEGQENLTGLWYKVEINEMGKPTITVTSGQGDEKQTVDTYIRFTDVYSEGAAGHTYIYFSYRLLNETGDKVQGVLGLSNNTDNNDIQLRLDNTGESWAILKRIK